MESKGEFLPLQAIRRGTGTLSAVPRLASPRPEAADLRHVLDGALTSLHAASGTAPDNLALSGFPEASDFAGRVEELSRAVEYLQLVAAAAVDHARCRTQAQANRAVAGSAASTAWLTGWSEGPGPLGSPSGTPDAPDVPVTSADSAVDDGYRSTTEFLRARLKISAAEARRRLALAADILPRTGLTGQTLPAVREELAAGVAAGDVASRAASIICLSLDRVRHVSPAEAVARMEQALVRTAADNDQDFLIRIAKRWTDALDQDGGEPSEQELRQRQGAFLRRPRRGLHHLEIFATPDQFEPLLTVMNVATNPRTGSAGAGPGGEDSVAGGWDHRTRPQRLLDGLVGGCKAALAAGKLSATGGLRPQVMVTIDYRDLLERVKNAGSRADAADTTAGTLTFTGPVTAATVRQIACDADIIPILLGGQGRILDIGRASRVFPPHIRKAITARDKGCAFPQCTMPAPWCEAHHVDYWSRGGTTGTGNGTLLCSHHHHLVHKEQWVIRMRSGVPWFIPPPHVDPGRLPRRNSYFRLE